MFAAKPDLTPIFSDRRRKRTQPADVCAAAYGGARALGVCTGVFTEEALRAANAEAVVVPDLTDLQFLLALIASEK